MKVTGSSVTFNDGKFLSFFVQFIVIAILCTLIAWITHNTITNLGNQGTVSGYDFLNKRAGFNQPSSIIAYDDNSTNAQVLLASIVNLIFMAILCLVTSTVLGLFIGMARLSKNWLLAKLALCYVEFFRNIPPLVLLFFWAFGIMQVLPSARQSVIFGPLTINIRGFYMPAPIWGNGLYLFLAITALCWIVGMALYIISLKTLRIHGKTKINIWYLCLSFIVLPCLAFLLFGWPQAWSLPELKGFNYSGGFYISPEFLSLYLALSIYTASLIAETFRSGFQAVDSGLKEAGVSLGLSKGLVTRLIVLPLAMRIIIPPLTSQYMNLIKNTSLGAAVGYSELMMVSSTIIEKTGQSIELASIWIIVYLGLSLVVSIFMNWFNAHMALVER